MNVWVLKHWQALVWLAALACFALGSYIGWSVNANLGAAMWLGSAVLAFIPFLSHRNPKDPQDGFEHR
ncbi:MAG: hypothetical protein AAF531_13905 [Actinomycetota bacterium]